MLLQIFEDFLIENYFEETFVILHLLLGPTAWEKLDE